MVVGRRAAAVASAGLLLLAAATGSARAGDVTGCDRPLGSRCTVAIGNGERLAYTEIGPKDGSVVLFLHGLTNSADAWVPVMRDLHRRLPGRRLIAVDLRGHGLSFRPAGHVCNTNPVECFGMDDMAGDVEGLLDALGIDRAAIAGHSMGSLVAQRVALDSPDEVTALVLVGTTSDATSTPILGDWLVDDVVEGQWRAALEAQGVAWPDPALTRTPLAADPNAVAWLQRYWNVYPVSPQRDTETIARQTAQVPIGTWLGATQAILAFHDTTELTRMRVPTLVLWGTQDVFFGRADQRRLVAALEVASEHGGSFCWKQYGSRPLAANGLQSDDLGHNLTWEAPAEVASDIASFLRRGRPTATGFTATPDGAVRPVPGLAPVCTGRGDLG